MADDSLWYGGGGDTGSQDNHYALHILVFIFIMDGLIAGISTGSEDKPVDMADIFIRGLNPDQWLILYYYQGVTQFA
jgi:hypothetical protein